MEICNSVNQQRLEKLKQFLDEHRPHLARQGAVVASWRQRCGQRQGPYYLLSCRGADGRQQAVYLGPESAVVDYARAALAQLQAPQAERRQFAEIRKSLRQGLAEARHQLDDELRPLGLRRQGSEIRGWRRLGEKVAGRLGDAPRLSGT